MDTASGLGLGLGLILLSALLVVSEYTIVASRRSSVEALSQRGRGNAQGLLDAIENSSRYIAAIQVGITLVGLGLGALTEPILGDLLQRAMGTAVPEPVSIAISLVLVTYVMVIFGELIPKYLALRDPEQLGLLLFPFIRLVRSVFSPISWLAERTASSVLRPFGIRMEESMNPAMSRDELALLIRAGESHGTLEESHAAVVNKALKFDKLMADDIMIHRLDIRWVDASLGIEELLDVAGKLPHSRVPVCNGDVDEIVGILYVQDLLRARHMKPFDLAKILRPAVVVPENLTLNRLVERMRSERTQFLIVVDEYGGTSGLVTLEDVIEEVLGDLEDQLERDRPGIEQQSPTRLSARSDVRYDELLDFLGVFDEFDPRTETLAEIIVNGIERVPKLGDTVQIPLGNLVVENMARHRVTRVRIILNEPRKNPD